MLCEESFVAVDVALIYDDMMILIYDDMMIYLLIAIGLTPGGSTAVHIYTQTIHTTQ
jgi:hypothetical protein